VQKIKVIKTIFMALLLGTTLPIFASAPSYSSTTVTKTITVKDVNGAVLPNAIIEFGYEDFSSSQTVWFQQTTNSSGQATFTAPQEIAQANYYIEPASGDLTDAVATLSTDLTSSTNDSISLSRATIAVDVLDPVNSTPYTPHYFSINSLPISPDLAFLGRSGAFGYDLPLNQAAGSYPAGYTTGTILSSGGFSTGAADQFHWTGCVTLTGTGTNKTANFYTDNTCTTSVATESDGAFEFQSPSYNVVGHLVNADGTHFTLPSGVSAKAYFSPSPSLNLNSNTVQQYGLNGTGSVKSDGTFYARFLGTNEGEYQVKLSFLGSDSLPPTLTFPIWMDSSGKLSTTQNGTYVAASAQSPFSFNAPITAQANNFIFKPVLINTSTAVPGSWQVTNSSDGSYVTGGNGSGNMNLSTGSYILDYVPDDAQYAAEKFSIVVSGSNVSVANTRTNFSVSNQATFTLPIETSNFAFASVAPNTSHPEALANWTNSFADLCVLISQFQTNSCFRVPFLTPSGIESFHLADGNYRMFLKPTNAPTDAETQFNIHVVNGVVTLTTDTGSVVTPNSSLGIYVLATSVPNFTAQIIDPSNPGVAPTGATLWLDPTYGIYSGGTWPAYQFTQNQSGLGSAYLVDGDYVAQLTTADGVLSRFHVHVANGVPTFQESVAKTGNVFQLPIAIPNFKFYMPDGNSIGQHAEWYEICANSTITNLTNCVSNGVSNSLTAGSQLTPGSYLLVVHPNNDTLAIKGWNVNVANDGTVTVPGATSTNGVWNVPGATPNVSFKVENPNDSSLLPNAYIWINKLDSSNNPTINYPNADVTSLFPGLTQSSLPDGNYRLGINSGDSALKLATRWYQMTIAGGVPTVTLNGQAVATSGGRFVVTPSKADFSFQMVDPTNNNAPIVDGWLDVCTDTGNGPSNTGPCNGYGVDQNGLGFVNLTPGNWYVRVNPGPAEALASKVYAVSVDSSGNPTVTGVAQPSGTLPWVLGAATPNIKGSFVGSDNQPLVISPNTQQGVNVQLQEMDSDGNWQWVSSGSWRQNDTYALDVTQANDITHTGHFRILVQPQNIANTSDSYSPEFWLTTGGNISLVSTTGSDAVTALNSFNITVNSPNLNLVVKNPIDSSNLPSGWVGIFKEDPNNVNNLVWVDNANISNSGDGTAEAYLPDGSYQLQVNAQINNSLIPGLTLNKYQAVVSGGGTSVVITHLGDNQTIAKNGSQFVLSAGLANITGRLLSSDGNILVPGPNQWVNINVQYQDSSGNWQYSPNWYNTDQSGNFSLSVNTAGTYRLLLQPNGYASSATTYTAPFTLTSANAATFKQSFGDITLPKPDLIAQVYESSTVTSAQNININVMRNNQFVSSAFTGGAGIASISFPAAGQYTLQLYPDSGAIQNGFTTKSYVATVTLNQDGSKSVSFGNASGVSLLSGGVVSLALGTSTIRGVVTKPAPSNSITVANAQVVPYDANGNQLWQYSSSTSLSGAWAISLPQGTYTLQAQQPYGDETEGSSDRIGTVTVASNGTATLSGALASDSVNNIALALKNPTWSGIVEAPAPSSTPIPYAQVCLIAVNNQWECDQANAAGQWALSAPSGFTNFDNSAQIQIQDTQGDNYASTFVQGAVAVNTALGGTSNNSVVLHVSNPNLQVTVLAGGQPAANVNVNLDVAATNNWLANAQTNSQGVANFNISNLNQGLIAQVDLSGNPILGQSYAYTTQQISASSSSSENVVVNLATPNVLGVVHAASTGSTLGVTIPYEWVELDSLDSQGGITWLGSTGTDANGRFAFYAPSSAGSQIRVVIHASQGGTTYGADSSYVASLNSGNVTNMELQGTSTPTPTETVNGSTYYDFSLNSPNVTGTVKDSSGNPVQYSWIQPFDVANRVWLNSPNSDGNGAFGLSLPNGTYQLQANPPGNTSSNAKSSLCQLTVNGMTVSNESANCNANISNPNNIQLNLHSPNLTFTLVSGGTAIANANVNIGVGAWNTWANSDAQGHVSLYIDPADIALLNPALSGSQNLNVWLNPPYGESNLMVSSYCYSGEANTPCQNLPAVTINSSFNSGNVLALGNLSVQTPNTHLQIKTPGGVNVGAGYWVNLESYDTATVQNFHWLGGSSTDSNGIAYFNVDTSTATANTVYGVIVNPSGVDAQTYTAGYIGDYQQYGDWVHGLTWANLVSPSTLLAPSLPNASITVKSGDGTVPNRYGGVNIYQLDNSGNYIRGWGMGTNYSGSASLLLPANARLAIIAYPNGVAGAPTTCTVTTNSANPTVITSATSNGTCTLGANNQITLTLSLGNVTGKVVNSDGTSPLQGAIVVAQIGSDTSTVVSTITGTNGAFGFNIDATKNYTITVISPIGSPYSNKNVPFTPVSSAYGEVPLGSIVMGN